MFYIVQVDLINSKRRSAAEYCSISITTEKIIYTLIVEEIERNQKLQPSNSSDSQYVRPRPPSTKLEHAELYMESPLRGSIRPKDVSFE